MAAETGVYLDKVNQVIRQMIDGDFRLEDAEKLIAATDLVLEQVEDKEHIRVMLDARKLGMADAAARETLHTVLRNKPIVRYAMWGLPAPKCFFMNIFLKAQGFSQMKAFGTENEGLDWVLER